MPARTFVIGVGMTPFRKPGSHSWDYPEMTQEATASALRDASVDYDRVEEAYVGYCYGDSTSGQRALSSLGLTGIPIVNVNNNCATGSTALYLARRAVKYADAECVLAVGFERMAAGRLGIHFPDRTFPLDHTVNGLAGRHELTEAPLTAQLFAAAAQEHTDRFGTHKDAFAKVAVKNHRHSVHNPYSQFRDEYSLEDVLNSPHVSGVLTRLQCCPTSDGAAAAVVASERFVDKHGLRGRAIEIVGQALCSDVPATFSGSDLAAVGVHVTQAAAQLAYEESGLGPEDAQVIELHDCFSVNELFTYEALGLCRPGRAADLIQSDATTYGGQWVVNPSGGLISKGHPLGATGLAQCAELTWQLRQEAGDRQVAGARVGIQHNIGLGGAAVVTVYQGPQPPRSKASTASNTTTTWDGDCHPRGGTQRGKRLPDQ